MNILFFMKNTGLNEEVDQVNVLGVEGDLGILYDHAPILTTMRAGRLSYELVVC